MMWTTQGTTPENSMKNFLQTQLYTEVRASYQHEARVGRALAYGTQEGYF
jgi:hypothetical protein